MTLTTVVLTKNAENDIARCLQSVTWSEEILVVDDESTDRTRDIAKKYGARLVQHALADDFAQQRNFALSEAKGDWILFVDSDEIITPLLREEIQRIIKDTKTDMHGYVMQRRDVMWGKEIKHGESGKIQLLRLARKGAGIWEGKVHERWKVKGETGYLEGILYHYPHPTLTEFLTDINWYTTLRAEELHKKGVRVHWYHILFYPKAKFVQNYILKKGFLDGTIGLVLALLMSFHSFLVRSKLWQLQKNK